jgi:hypothetical protein
MRKPKNLGRQALNKRSGRPRLKACDAQNMGYNRPHAVGFPIRGRLFLFCSENTSLSLTRLTPLTLFASLKKYGARYVLRNMN